MDNYFHKDVMEQKLNPKVPSFSLFLHFCLPHLHVHLEEQNQKLFCKLSNIKKHTENKIKWNA